MTDLVILPDPLPAMIDWLVHLDQVTALLDDRIGTKLPATAHWPACRFDPIGGITPVDLRIDQPRYQVQCFDLTDRGAITVARTVRAGLIAMNGLYRPGELCITDVTASGWQLIEPATVSDAEPARLPPISHATFSTAIAVRPDP